MNFVLWFDVSEGLQAKLDFLDINSYTSSFGTSYYYFLFIKHGKLSHLRHCLSFDDVFLCKTFISFGDLTDK